MTSLLCVSLFLSIPTRASVCSALGEHAFSVMRMIGLALVVKAVLTAVTFGIKVPTGIFNPCCRIPPHAVPVMLGVLVAKTTAYALEVKGIRELVIECVCFWC
ncbi:hypothetical protein H4582DRAFT_2125005 [Lactarius indigo]|nr:hypothetical protein H4582DRAFT_2125005 [Lactarius indigo]